MKYSAAVHPGAEAWDQLAQTFAASRQVSADKLEHFPYSCALSEFNQAQLFLNGKAALRFSLRSIPIGEML